MEKEKKYKPQIIAIGSETTLLQESLGHPLRLIHFAKTSNAARYMASWDKLIFSCIFYLFSYFLIFQLQISWSFNVQYQTPPRSLALSPSLNHLHNKLNPFLPNRHLIQTCLQPNLIPSILTSTPRLLNVLLINVYFIFPFHDVLLQISFIYLI